LNTQLQLLSEAMLGSVISLVLPRSREGVMNSDEESKQDFEALTSPISLDIDERNRCADERKGAAAQPERSNAIG